MKKLIWSTFAMSLFLNVHVVHSQTEAIDDFLGMESEILPELKGKQRFTPLELHQKPEWNVKEAEVILDSEPMKGQPYSLIQWQTQDPEDFLSINKWLSERDLKDKKPEWKLLLRDDLQMEHVGKILQCKGICTLFRGTRKASVEHLSRIDEGDELHTDKDTVAWIYLMDGSLIRLGPETIVSFQEINWSHNEVFHLLRLAQGYIYWHPRSPLDYPQEFAPETDAINLPLLVRDANQAYFERKIFQSQNDRQTVNETIKLEESAIKNQIAKINELKVLNNTLQTPVARVMMVAPNGTLVAKNTSFDLLHYPGGKSHFKKRAAAEGQELMLHLRGYSDNKTVTIAEDAWYEIGSTGREYSKVETVIGALEITELLTRRIKTIELAREIWMDKYTAPIVKSLARPQELAVKHGYRSWTIDLQRRIDFLVEYTRRMETSNLKSMDNILKKLAANGEFDQKEISDSHYKATLSYYLRGLKTRYTNKLMQVREMTELQYYIWIVRHGTK